MNLRAFLLILLVLAFFACTPKRLRIYEDLQETRTRIVEFALSLIGAPYRAGSKGPNAFDCSGLVYYVYSRFGISLPSNSEGLLSVGKKINTEEVYPGDLVFFRVEKSLHVGIMVNREEFVHVSKSQGVRISSIKDRYWSKHLLLFRRVL